MSLTVICSLTYTYYNWPPFLFVPPILGYLCKYCKNIVWGNLSLELTFPMSRYSTKDYLSKYTFHLDLKEKSKKIKWKWISSDQLPLSSPQRNRQLGFCYEFGHCSQASNSASWALPLMWHIIKRKVIKEHFALNIIQIKPNSPAPPSNCCHSMAQKGIESQLPWLRVLALSES